jgi:4-hydroxy-tetrahydrodipicolinate reductase
MSALRIAVAGAGGRMGQAVLRAISESPDFTIAGALVRENSRNGELPYAGKALVTGDASAAIGSADAIVDFSSPECSAALAELAGKARLPHVIGTTGFSAEQDARIAAAASQIVIVKSGNMSLGVTLLTKLVREAARALPYFDIEILEMHHRIKTDAPSGTALLLGGAAAEGRNVSLDDLKTLQRNGARKPGTIGFASLRGGTVVGEHQVILAGPHERIMLSHSAEDRTIFACGALAAARWAQDKPPGLYSMADVLGIPG